MPFSPTWSKSMQNEFSPSWSPQKKHPRKYNSFKFCTVKNGQISCFSKTFHLNFWDQKDRGYMLSYCQKIVLSSLCNERRTDFRPDHISHISSTVHFNITSIIWMSLDTNISLVCREHLDRNWLILSSQGEGIFIEVVPLLMFRA